MGKDKKTPITIDDKEYIFEDMTPEQQAMVNHISDLDRKIASARFNLDQLQVGKNAFVNMLTESLKDEQMNEVVQLINEVGFPIAAALGLGIFIWKLINRIVDGMESKVSTMDEKVEAQIEQLENRLGTKLDTQHGILVALIDRVRSLDNELIRQDTMIKTLLGVPQLINSNKIAKADRDDQRKDQLTTVTEYVSICRPVGAQL